MRSIDWCILLAVLGLLWTQTHSLKCRSDDEEDDDFNEVARMCMRNMSNWDSPSSNNRYSSRKNVSNDSNSRNYGNRDNNNANGCGDNNGGSSRDNKNSNNRNNNNNDGSYGSGSSNNNNNGGRNSGDNGGSTWSYGGGWQQSSSNRGSSENGGTSDSSYYGSSRYRRSKNSSDRGRNNGNSWSNNKNNNYSMELSGNSSLENIEPCIIHCIFREMQMLDDAGYPEKSSVKNIMTRKIRNPEVSDFIEDSIEECYDLLNAGNRRDRCEYSKSLALCLEEKGRRTCEDWDAPKNSGG